MHEPAPPIKAAPVRVAPIKAASSAPDDAAPGRGEANPTRPGRARCRLAKRPLAGAVGLGRQEGG